MDPSIPSAKHRHSIFDILHDDCLELIFAYLTLEEKTRYELVCKRWRANMYKYQNELKIRHLKGGRKRKLLIGVLSSVTQKCEFIEKVDFTSITPHMSKQLKRFLPVIGKNCVHLAEIVVDVDHDETLDALIDFGKIFGKKLKRLTCSWKTWKVQWKVNKSKLIEFLEECIKLEEITLTRVDALKENDDHFLPKLKRITSRLDLAFDKLQIDFLIRNVRYAKYLTNIYVRDEQLKEKLISLIPSLHRLETLQLSGMQEVVTSLTEHCSQTLQCITITLGSSRDKSLAIPKYNFFVCPKLIEFRFYLRFSFRNVHSVSNHIFNNISSSFPALVRLTIYEIFDEKSIDLMLPDWMKFDKIQHLTLYNYGKKQMLLSNVALNQLVNSFPHLKYLYLYGIHEANEETIKSLVKFVDSRPTRDMGVSLQLSTGTKEKLQLGNHKNLQLELSITEGNSFKEEINKYRE